MIRISCPPQPSEHSVWIIRGDREFMDFLLKYTLKNGTITRKKVDWI